MLLLKCAACRRKLWKYDKLGGGEVLRCHKHRIGRVFHLAIRENKVICRCGKQIGIDKGTFYKMIAKAFTYSGTKRN